VGLRTAVELRTGCRRGNVSALDALLYQTADGMYAMALSAMEDEETAREVVREAWERMLSALQGPRFSRDPRRAMWRITEQVLAERAGRERARAARRAVTDDDGRVGLEGVGLSREVLEELSAKSEQCAPTIRARWKVRRNVFRISIAALFLIAIGVWGAVIFQRARAGRDLEQMQYECLRQRVLRQDLTEVMREVSFQLDDPTGVDREAAADCERVMLVLEEIANSATLNEVSGLRYVRQRVRQHDLPQFVASLEETFPEMGESLPRVRLVLEEVQNL